VNVLAWILFGLLAGALARRLTPGDHPSGCAVTAVVGISGAVVGGFAGNVLFGKKIDWSFSLRPFLVAVAGAVIVLLVLQALSGRHDRH